jgi:putative membrane protein
VKPEDMQEFNMATSMKGADFDKDFAKAMVNGHQKAIDMFQQEADSADPAPVTGFAKQMLPGLKTHLQTAQSLQK